MAANDNAVTCANGALTFMDLLAAAIGKDASGKKYLRLYKTTPVAGSKGIACGNGSEQVDVEAEIRNCFTLDSNGDIALRVSILP